jgi:hypothetical protein
MSTFDPKRTSSAPAVKDFHCPVCDKPTPTKLWNLLPGVGFCRRVFWCGLCREWFEFTARARRNAVLASLIVVALPFALLRIYAELAGITSIAWEGPTWALASAVYGGPLVLHNVTSAWILARQARLEGPIDHSP